MWDGTSAGGGASSKRSHEEALHSHYSKNSSIDESASGSFVPSASATYSHSLIKPSSDYHASHASFIRTDPGDTDKRASSLPSTYKIPALVSGGLTTNHPISSDNKAEHKDFSHANHVYAKAELHSESNRDTSKEMKYDKGGKETEKVDTRYNENINHDREVHAPDMRCDIKAGNSYLNWKELNDHLRGKRYMEGNMESGTGSMEARHTSGSHFHAPNEIGTSEKIPGMRKLDSKGEEKLKEKDRKRKDGKYRDLGESKKERNERNVSLQVGNSHADSSDLPRDQRESDKRGRDIKHQTKEKERLIERTKDHYNVKLEPRDSDGLLHSTRNVSDRAIKVEDPQGKYFEQKWLNNVECRRATNKDVPIRANDRGTDIEVDRPQKFNNMYDNVSDDRCIDVGGGTEGDRVVLIHGSLQNKRIHRPKGSPQILNNDDRSRCQGKPEPPFLIYKVGECMQELVKLWREYESYQPETNDIKLNDFPVLEIRIPAEHVSATNRQVRGGQLWGTDTYTVDSDLAAVLMHTGYCRPTASLPSPVIEELRATIRVLPPQDCYVSSLRNNVRSRAWGSAICCSYLVEKCCIVKKGGGKFDLEPCASHTSTLEPTLAPVAAERTMTTRAAASNALRQQRFIREVTIQYSLSNEPWIKYSISIVADKGLKKPMYTSARLKKGEVLYLETYSRRYELCFSGEKTVKGGIHEGETERCRGQNMQINGNDGDSLVVDTFRWSRCKDPPLTQEVMRSFGVPLPHEFVEVLEENIDWEDIQWSQSGVWIVGKEYPLTRVHFLVPN